MDPPLPSRGIFLAKKTQKYKNAMAERSRQEVANSQESSQTNDGFLLGPIVNIFPEVPRERIVTVKRFLLPNKARIIVQGNQGRHEASFSNFCFLHTDDWSQIHLSNETDAEVEFHILYYCPIGQYLRLVLNKTVGASLQAVVVINALGQPLRCSGCRWPFGVRAVYVNRKLEMEFYNWAGLTPFVLNPPRSLQDAKDVLKTVQSERETKNKEKTRSILKGEACRDLEDLDPIEGSSTGTGRFYTVTRMKFPRTPLGRGERFAGFSATANCRSQEE